jgi:hypothetical protein
MLRMFDRTGRARWQSGTRGMGPGEYTRPMRAVRGPGIVQVIDMSQRRVSRLDGEGRYVTGARFTAFPAAVAAQGRTGSFVMLLDDFRGGKTLQRWQPGDSGVTLGPAPAAAEPPQPGLIVFPVLAVAPNGALAFAPDINTYRILLLNAAGTQVGSIARDLPRVKRTAAEMAAQERLRTRVRERVQAERNRSGPPPAATPRPAGDPELKPHIAIDGLRFDDEGRLWVRTMRGDESSTVFDVFTPAGALAREVTIDAAAGSFSLAGRWLAAGIITEEGFAAVRLYEVP